jgi:hypothetical protein
VPYGLDPSVGRAGWIGVEAGAGDWSITVSPISALPALPETGGYDTYLYSGTEQSVVFSSTNTGRVGVRQLDGVSSTDSIAPQEDFTAAGTSLPGPSVVSVQFGKRESVDAFHDLGSFNALMQCLATRGFAPTGSQTSDIS